MARSIDQGLLAGLLGLARINVNGPITALLRLLLVCVPVCVWLCVCVLWDVAIIADRRLFSLIASCGSSHGRVTDKLLLLLLN